MHTLKVAAASLNQTPLAWEHNRTNILSVIEKARQEGVVLLCCPELCITGYGCEDAFLSTDTCQMAIKVLREIVLHTEGMIVAVGLPILYRDGLYNTACLMCDGKILGFVAKQHLAERGVHYEPRWFRAWPKGISSEVALNGDLYPIGDLIFNINSVRIGFEICEDAWVPVRTGVNLAKRGVDILLNLSASHFAFGKCQVRKRFVQEGARSFGVGYIYANLLGNESGRLLYDGDTLIAAGEDFLKQGPRFSFQDHIITTASIDIQRLRINQNPASENTLPETPKKDTLCFSFSLSNPVSNKITSVVSETPKMPTWEKGEYVKEEEFARAVSLGLFDYLRKSHAYGFVVNLSGGADSAAVACLVFLMQKLALQELGAEKLAQKLTYIPSTLQQEPLLYCLYQRTENNSTLTEEAAEALCAALGFSFAAWSIEPLVTEYRQLLEPIVGRPLTWAQDDLTLQNIQSRVRAPGAWILANVRRAILLCTSNRSEASVGYCTMDGDTAGGLCPLAGVDKSFILHWLGWLEKKGIEGIGPLSVLDKITSQKPTAELRPKQAEQTDEADLMPYDLLDAIERLFVRDKQSPLEIYLTLQSSYPQLPAQTLALFIERFFAKWANNQWKRERLAPSFHLDDESVDPKTWCRFPILSGGYKRELALMWETLQQ